jgi:hypothetical protein
VDWNNDLRLLTQLHDHVEGDSAKIKAYDDAGYNVVGLLDYSGASSLAYAKRERLWPPDRLLSEGFRSGLQNIRLFIPDAEEVGYLHLISPFLTEYIERWERVPGAPQGPRQYSSTQEGIELIQSLGGLAFIAHPWGMRRAYGRLEDYDGVEIYNAIIPVQQRNGVLVQEVVYADVNDAMIQVWDDLLQRNPSLLGIAVNDHFGPGTTLLNQGDVLRDSGKIEVYSATADLATFRRAFERGAFVAVRDLGVTKNHYPTVRAISVSDQSIEIDADGDIVWVSGGSRVGRGGRLSLDALQDPSSSYVRAEVHNDDGSVVYTQSFTLRPVGDIDGDGIVTPVDDRLCRAIERGHSVTVEQADACAAARRRGL